MPLLSDGYTTSGLFKNAHVSSMYPSLFRGFPRPAFKRERITTPDDDFLDIDILKAGNKKVLFLFHGLEGSTDSNYMRANADLFYSNGFDVIAVNYRGCSGEMNRYARAYHSGATEDVDFVLNKYLPSYVEAVMLGYSLGGNLILKYTGDGIFALSEKIKAVMAVSAPIDLYGCILEISKTKNILYELNFLKTLKAKTLEKCAVFPDLLDADLVKRLKTLYDFDDLITGPIHGYKNALDYYARCNSLQFIPEIKIPSLLITAQNDPFLSDSCYPIDIAKDHTYFHLKMTKYGGHCGFHTKGKSYYWDELELLHFAKKYIQS